LVVSTHIVDVAKREDLVRFVDEVLHAHSNNVDVLFNNAGIASWAPFQTMREEEFDKVVAIDLLGLVKCTRLFLPHLKRSKEGYIVNVSSVAGIVANPGFSAYCVAKFGVRGFSEVLMQECKVVSPNIKVAVVHPGMIHTNVIQATKMEGVDELGFAPHGPKYKTPEDAKKDFLLMYKILGSSSVRAAGEIIQGMKKDSTRIMVGYDAPIIDMWVRLFPRLYMTAIGTSLMGATALFGGRLLTPEAIAAFLLTYTAAQLVRARL